MPEKIQKPKAVITYVPTNLFKKWEVKIYIGEKLQKNSTILFFREKDAIQWAEYEMKRRKPAQIIE